jgi:hypothetical protein
LRRVATAAAFAGDRAAVLRFRRSASSASAPVVTGLVNTWVLAGSVPALAGTDYGHPPVIKVALFWSAVVRRGQRLGLRRASSRPPSVPAVAQALRQIVQYLIEAGLGTTSSSSRSADLAPELQDQAIN